MIYSYLKDGAYSPAVKGNAKFLNSYVKGAPFVIEGITKWVPFLSKNSIWKGKGLDRWSEPPLLLGPLPLG